MPWVAALLFILFQLSHATTTLTETCKGHDACKKNEWIGSYNIVCKNGERLCQETILKCGRESCTITIKGSGHDNYHDSIVYAQNIRAGGTFELTCSSTGNRQCRNNVIYCPREEQTTCKCTNCHSTTIMYYKQGISISSGGATLKRIYDGPTRCEGRVTCRFDSVISYYDYSSTPYNSRMMGYTSTSTSAYNYIYYTKYGAPLQFIHTISENYSSLSYTNGGYTIINYVDTYGSSPKFCRGRDYENNLEYYVYRPTCRNYQYGNPYDGFWVLGEPAKSCTDACLDYNMTCNKQMHLNHLVEINTTDKLNNLLTRFHVSCETYTSEWLNGKRTPVYNTLTRQCILSNTTRTGTNWFCNEPPWSNGGADENKRRLCWCAPTTTKPMIQCEQNITNLVNVTRWVNRTKLRYINRTRYVNETRWINRTRYINETRWINRTRYLWINRTRYINETRYRWINRTRYMNKTRSQIYNVKDIVHYINRTRWTNYTWYNVIDIVHYINRTRWVNYTWYNVIDKVVDIVRYINTTRIIEKMNCTNNTLKQIIYHYVNNNRTHIQYIYREIVRKIIQYVNKTEYVDKDDPDRPWWPTFISMEMLIIACAVCLCICSLYVWWECWLIDHIIHRLNKQCCCGVGKYIRCIVVRLYGDDEIEPSPRRRPSRIEIVTVEEKYTSDSPIRRRRVYL